MVKKCHLNFVGLEGSFWHCATELDSLSVANSLCGSALTNTTDNLFEMCQLKLTDFCLFCTIDHTQPCKAHTFPNGFNKLS